MIRDKRDLATLLPFKEENGLILATPKKDITLGYSSKSWGDSRKKNPFFENIKSIYHQPQCHTNIIVEIPNKDAFPPSYDGSLTKDSHALLKGSFADCLPLYFYTLNGDWIGLAHSGWQGSFEGISQVMLKALFQKGFSAQEIGCVIGPYRSFFHYEVKRDFKDIFINRYDTLWILECFQESEGKYFFDNGLFNLFLMNELGMKELYFLDLDMGIHEEFFSHRRGEFGRNVAFIFKE